MLIVTIYHADIQVKTIILRTIFFQYPSGVHFFRNTYIGLPWQSKPFNTVDNLNLFT